MPTSKTNTSALENTDTARGKDEVESFKANVSIMTQEQDQCLENNDDFETKSNNNRSSSDKVSDDLNESKNNFISNGVSSVQEFNIDVDSEHTVDSMGVDANSSPTGKVLPTSKRFSETPSDFVYPKDILDNSIHNVVAENGEWANKNIASAMTVITHQNSNENIRDIIANSEKANKNTSDSQLITYEMKSDMNNGRNHFKNPKSSNKSSEIKRNRKLIRSGNINECEDDKIEDPIERLNKLRASISSALSEVKGVLKQYSTEQNCDVQNESTPSNEPPDDGPVRFRFVRKIRRRSAFSEDDESEIPTSFSDVKTSPIVENKTSEEIANDLKDNSQVSSNEKLVDSKKDANQDSPDFKEAEKPIKTEIEVTDKQLIQVASEQVPQGIDHVAAKESEIQKIISDKTSCAAENSKIKNGKTKKILKKDRRASIAAVEINQISNEQLSKELELKTQRRPSDSGTVVKQPTRVKVKKSEKSKLPSHLKAKTDSLPRSTAIVKLDEKIDIISSPINDQSTSSNIESTKTIELKTIEAAIIENLPLVEARVSGTPATLLQSKEAPPSCEAERVLTSSATIVTSTNVKDDSSQIVPSTIDTKTTVTPAEHYSKNVTIDSENCPSTSIDTNKADNLKKTTTTLIKSIQGIETVAPSEDTNMPIGSISAKIPEKPNSAKAGPDETTNTQNKAASVIGSISTDSNENKDISKDANISIELMVNSNTAKPGTESESSETSKNTAVIVQTAEQTVQNKNTIEIVDSNVEKPVTKSLLTETSKKAAGSVQTGEKIVPNKKSIEFIDSSIAKPGTKSVTKETSKNAAGTVQTAKPEIKLSTGETSKKAKGTLLTQINKRSSIEQKVQINETSDAAEPEEPKPLKVPKDALAVKLNLPGQESVDELQRLEQQQENETSSSQTSEPLSSELQKSETATVPPKKKRKAKRKVVIRRIKRKLSKDDTFLHTQEAASQVEICEKEIEEKDLDEEPEAEEETIEVSKTPKPCIKLRQFEIGDVVMYAEHYKKTQVRWKKAVVTERITSISYKLNIEGEERPAHISYIKKFTDRKVNFGGKEYLEIDYEQIAEDEEKERNYSIWNLV